MIITHFPNSRFTSIISTLIITLLISACSTEDLSTAVTSADTTTENPAINTDTVPVTDNESNSSSISLSWTAPSEREDNSPISLSEIAGYTVRYGTTMGQYPNMVTINDGSATSYTFSAFPAGTYYFVLTTIDTEGRESQNSGTATVVN